jgi:ubiquinone/menaquinone biosynthesis C-methylase UbiE
MRSRIPPTAFVCALLALTVAYFRHAAPAIMFPAAGVCIFGAFVWGYSARMTREWPRLRELRRADYASVWDALSPDSTTAARAATGVSDEYSLQAAGRQVAARIAGFVSVTPTDTVLEIGSGVGRVGWAMAPICGTWIGCDVSKRMLGYAQRRLAIFDNVRFVRLSDPTLSGIPDSSVDVVYCTNVLAHLNEMERWQYVAESHRVLRAGGRLYVDTIVLDSTDGWAMLLNNLAQRRRGVDPPYMPVPSTGEEFTAYFKNAGFNSVRIEIQNSLLIATAMKGLPGGVGFENSSHAFVRTGA